MLTRGNSLAHKVRPLLTRRSCCSVEIPAARRVRSQYALTVRTSRLLRQEWADLYDTLASSGPEAPTLCGGWTTSVLAAHVVATQKGRGIPVFLAFVTGLIAITTLGPLRPVAQRQFGRLMDHELARGYPALLRELHRGPPLTYQFPGFAWVRLWEIWIHHEDVRRANGGSPRQSAPKVESILWRMVAMIGITQGRRFGSNGVVARSSNRRAIRLHCGSPEVHIVGAPGEVLLFLNGRKKTAAVQLEGPAHAVSEVAMAQLGV
ncbi:MAG: maleylpyruvate isomerase family mycothiol-dependent enzyme [Acidimicrobiales bacterium]